jgi:cell division septation protein DedD
MNETYEFSFERGQLIKVIGGILSLVVLVFCAGLLVGVALEFHEPMPTLVAQSKQLSPQTVAVPAPPVLVSPPADPVNSEETAAVAADDDDAAIDPNQPAVEEKEDKADKSAVKTSDEPAQPGIPGRFAVQLGAFLQPDNAEVLSRKLLARGYDADVVVREDSHGRMWYLVRYGIFSNRSEASAIAFQFKSRENLDALVRPSNSM